MALYRSITKALLRNIQIIPFSASSFGRTKPRQPRNVPFGHFSNIAFSRLLSFCNSPTRGVVAVLLIGLLVGIAIPAWANTRTFMAHKLFFIDNRALSGDYDKGLGIGGLPANVIGLQVSGNARFKNSVGTTPLATTNPAIDWTAAAHQLLTIENSAVTQSITFTNPGNPCSLLLVVYRNIGVTFPSSVLWQSGGTVTFPKPDSTNASYQTGYQEDVIGFIYDGTNYIGIVNKNFKGTTSNTGR